MRIHAALLSAAVALTHVNIVDPVTGEVLRGRTLLMRERRILRILADGARVPDGFGTLDGGGGYAIPGLWDSHVHLTDASLVDAVAEGPSFLAAGVTSVRDMGGSLAVLDTLQVLKGEGRASAPHVIRAGPFVDSAKDGAPDRLPVESPDHAEAAVRALVAERVDFIKIHNGLSRENFLAVMSSANAHHLRVAVHLPRSVTAEEAIAAGIATLEHTETLMESGLRSLGLAGSSVEEGRRALDHAKQEVLARMKVAGTCFTPTLVEYRSFAGLSAGGYPVAAPRVAPPSLLAFWDKYFPPEQHAEERHKVRQQIFDQFLGFVRAASDAGVTMLAGTDLGARDIYPGASLHEELALLSKAGLSNLQVLRAAVLNPAACMGLRRDYGSLEAGKVADVVVLPGNPLSDLAVLGRPRLVISEGRPAR